MLLWVIGGPRAVLAHSALSDGLVVKGKKDSDRGERLRKSRIIQLIIRIGIKFVNIFSFKTSEFKSKAKIFSP